MKRLLLVLALVLGAAPSFAQVRVNGVSNPTFGAVTVTTIDSGFGPNEVRDQNQDLQTTDTIVGAGITVGTTDGVCLTSDGDGALIMTGCGQGSDESLTWNFDDTSNVVTVASNSSVATLFLSSIVMSAPGFFHGSVRLTSSGAPAVSSCGDGALQTGSTDTVGRVVGTTQTACTITFSAAFGTNSAECIVENITANRGNVSAASTTAFTVSNLTAGDDFSYICMGR